MWILKLSGVFTFILEVWVTLCLSVGKKVCNWTINQRKKQNKWVRVHKKWSWLHTGCRCGLICMKIMRILCRCLRNPQIPIHLPQFFFLVHALISVIQDELLSQKTKCLHSIITPHFNLAFKLRSELDDPAKCAHHFHLVIFR